jgi:predicted nucleic acid-binding protein
VSLYYIDTSAALKLLVEESDSRALARLYDDHVTSSWVSSTLLRVEMLRAVTRVRPSAIPNARDLLLAFGYVGVGDEIIDAAMAEPDPLLRSLDAIHLATARTLGSALDGLVTYDDRLGGAAARAGITVVSPRDR